MTLPVQETESKVAALDDIAAERQRQIASEGWSTAHDDGHANGELAIAAAWYAINSPYVARKECLGDPSHIMHGLYDIFKPWSESEFKWPWSLEWWRPKNQRRDLVRAGALIVAEIERLDRSAPLKAQGNQP
jgi:hypothetical protein